MTNVQGAVESAAPVSGLHELRSFDPADFGVPRGREEEWRFTPLRRLRGLHTDTALPPAKVAVECDLAPEVTAEEVVRTDPRVARNWVPADRVSARAFAAVSHATVLTVPRGVAASRPSTVSVRGDERRGGLRPPGGRGPRREASATVVLDYTGSATYADNVELIVGDGPS
jgi:Fe-S cluster assembly protein SufD